MGKKRDMSPQPHRQPREFRVEGSDVEKLRLTASLEDHYRRWASALNLPGPAAQADMSAPVERVGGGPNKPSDSSLSTGFVKALCNEYFKLRRAVEQISRGEGPPKEVGRLKRSIENLRDLLEAWEIECRDLTGEAYDVGREDFESLAPPELTPGLDRDRIVLCECPAVLMRGKLIQRASGVVGTPA